ncbi:GA module-containing protein [Mycoplasma sp. 1331]|uniref:GA module-containing protein n=1 Tax=Mycoplasma tauri TaxID=547987 RepID=A0A953T7B3_9MOLU|nr:GA module-containing protein [Mycoplasma tauri]MBZ4195497.1 GA module-containing protein [Mycoplasma tauri]
MSKSSNEKKSKLIKSAIIIGAITAVSLPPILIASLDNLSPTEIKRIVEEINSWNIKVNDQILTLDNNQHSVDTLEKSIEDAEKVLFDAEKAINSLDKEEYKKYSKIQNALSDTKANLAILKDKKDASKSVLENNRKKLDVIVKEATETSKKAIELAENTLEIDLEGLKAANKELEAALNEVNEAKEKAKDSAKHIDNLILLANKVKVAEDKVAEFIKEIQKLSKKQLNDKFNKEVQKHIDALKQKNNEFNPNDMDLDSISAFSKSLEDEITKGKRVYEFINKQNVDDNTKDKNEELNKVIADSENISKKLEEKALEIKSDIDSKIEALKNIINQASSNIDSHNDFDALKKEFEASNERIDGEILNLANKAQEVKYHDAKSIIEESKTKDIENKTKALNKMKALVLGILDESSNLKPEQISKFKNEIENATLPEQLEAIRNDIQLTNKKEKAKDNLNSGYGLLTPEYKENLNNLIDKAESEQQINDILTQAKELVDKKKTAQNSIDNDFEHLSDNQKQNYKNEISSADSKDKVDEILANAKTLNDEKKEKIENIEKLEKLTEKDKNRFKEEIKNSGTSSEDEQQENTPSKVLEKAIELNDSKKDALDKLEKLENITNKDSIKEQINNATTKEEVQRIILDAEALNKDKSDAKEAINKLDNLSQNEKQEYINQINNASESTNFETIKQEATNKNQEKDQLINEIDSLDFANNSKAQFKQNIKNKSLDEAKAYLEELKTLNKNKNEIKQLIENPQNNIPEDVKNRLKESLTNAATKDEIDNVKKDVELEIEKQKAIKEIKDLNIQDKNKEKEFIDAISNSSDEQEIKSIVETAKGNLLEAAKLRAESKIKKLDFISDVKIQEIKNELKQINDSNKDQILQKVEDLLIENNKKKELFESNIANNSDLFTPEYINQIKTNIKNEDNDQNLTKIKNDFIALNNNKKDLKEKINNKSDFKYLGDNNIEKFNKELIQKANNEEVEQLKQEINELNNIKKDLFEKVEKLDGVSTEEINEAKNKIKEAADKDEALKIFEELEHKSKKENAKKEIEKLSNLSKEIAQKHFIDLINKANKDDIDNIVENANKINKINENNINELKKLPLLNQNYLTDSENKIKNNTSDSMQNSVLDVSRELSRKKTETQNEIKNQQKSLTESQNEVIQSLLTNANNDNEIENVKKEAELWNIQNEAQKYLENTNNIYLNDQEKTQLLREIKDSRESAVAKAKFDEIKRKNEIKKTYYNDLDAYKSSFVDSVIETKKLEIKNSDENNAKIIHDELKNLDTNLKSAKTNGNKLIDNEFNSNSINTSRRDFYKNLISELKYNEELLAKNNKEDYMKQEINKIVEVAKKEAVLFSNNDNRLLLNDSEKNNFKQEINKIASNTMSNKTEALNKIQKILSNVDQLHKDKENISKKIDRLSFVKEDLKNRAKSNIKNQTKKQAQNKLNELKKLNTEINKSIKRLDTAEFSQLSPESKNNYKQEIKNVNALNNIQPIINRAKTEVNFIKAKNRISEINRLSFLSRDEKNQLIREAQQYSNHDDYNKINQKVDEAIRKNTEKNNWIKEIRKYDLLTQIWKTNSEDYIKVNSYEVAKNRFNKLKQAQELKKERERNINSLPNELPSWVKNQLIEQLKSKDYIDNSSNYDTKHLNDISAEILEWRNSGPKYITNYNNLNSIKDIMNEFAMNDKNNHNLQTHYNNFKTFIQNNTLVPGNNKDNLRNKKNAIERDIVTHFNTFNQDVVSFLENIKTNASSNLVNTINQNDDFNGIKQQLKDELGKVKTQLNSWNQKLENIKNKANSISPIHNLNEYQKAKSKEQEIQNWLNKKIELVDKYAALIEKVKSSPYLKTRDKERLENKIKSQGFEKDSLDQKYNLLDKEINDEIRKNKDIVDAYITATNDLQEHASNLRDFESISNERNLNIAHQSIIQKNEKLVQKYRAEQQKNLEDGNLHVLTEKIRKSNETIEEYINRLRDTKTYVEKYGATSEIKNAAWKKYYDHIVEITRNSQGGKETNLFTILGNSGNQDDSQYKNLVIDVLDKTYLEVERLVFKKEIIRLIGNGKWSMPDNESPAFHESVETKITNAYIENPHVPIKNEARLILDPKHYHSFYQNNLIINYRTDTWKDNDVTGNSTKRGYYDFWSKGIKFSYNGNGQKEHKIEYRLKIKRKDNRTWFVIRALPDKQLYESGKSQSWVTQIDTNSKNWVTESDLELINS